MRFIDLDNDLPESKQAKAALNLHWCKLSRSEWSVINSVNIFQYNRFCFLRLVCLITQYCLPL